MPRATEIAAFADSLLRSAQIPDYPGSLNGLQVGTDADISGLAAAVDFSARAVRGARNAGANLLLVHHGAFWGQPLPLTGTRFSIMKELLSSSIGVYSSHLPLDSHPTIGNNVLLAKKLGLVPDSAFGHFNNYAIGVSGRSAGPVNDLLKKVEAFSHEHGGSVRHSPFQAGRSVGNWAVCSGAGADASTLREATDRGINTFIVGEGPHWTAVHAEEHDLILVYAGHYATETLGVQALAEALAAEFKIPWCFIPAPTGT